MEEHSGRDGKPLSPASGCRDCQSRYCARLKPWDKAFLKWIEASKMSGKDPNDFGDEDWRDDPLRQTLERFYLCYIDAQSVVLELGPGTAHDATFDRQVRKNDTG